MLSHTQNLWRTLRISADFLEESWQAKRERDDIFKLMKEKKPANQEYFSQEGCLSEMKMR